MTQKELYTMLTSTGLEVAYGHFADDENVALPFITYSFDTTANMSADNSVYQHIQHVQVDLFSAEQDRALEKRLEDVFSNNEIIWASTDTNEEDELVYRITYDFMIYLEDENG